MNIHVAKPFLPPKEKYYKYVDEIYKRCWITNHGPLVNDLELKLKKYLGLEHLIFTNNGTVALQIAIKTLDLTGDIITTPFSYIATAASISWQNCTPIFCDINPETLTIDPDKIKLRITDKTSAILATHVYGNACEIDKIQDIAKEFNLKVIYDAAHAFGSKYRGKSVYLSGDISIASFHATKLFHTVEGGAVITKDPEYLKKASYHRNFGHDGPYEFTEIGINGKNSEFHAAMGLANIDYVDDILNVRKKQWLFYHNILQKSDVRFLKINPNCEFNFAYFPVIFNTEEILMAVTEKLNNQYIFPRRYFYPSLSTLKFWSVSECKVSEDIAKRILCLPLYYDLSQEEQEMICRIILRILNYK